MFGRPLLHVALEDSADFFGLQADTATGIQWPVFRSQHVHIPLFEFIDAVRESAFTSLLAYPCHVRSLLGSTVMNGVEVLITLFCNLEICRGPVSRLLFFHPGCGSFGLSESNPCIIPERNPYDLLTLRVQVPHNHILTPKPVL